MDNQNASSSKAEGTVADSIHDEEQRIGIISYF